MAVGSNERLVCLPAGEEGRGGLALACSDLYSHGYCRHEHVWDIDARYRRLDVITV